MLIGIGIDNFKAFGEYREIKFQNLNLLTGLNSAGKSTIYQALMLLIQSDGHYVDDQNGNRLAFLQLNGEMIQFGKSEEILHDKNKKEIKFVLFYKDTSQVELTYKLYGKNVDFKQSGQEELKSIFVISKFKLSENGKNIIVARRYPKKNRWYVEALLCLGFLKAEYAFKIRDCIKNNIDPNEGVEKYFSEKVIFKNVISVWIGENVFHGLRLHFSDIKDCLDENYKSFLDISLLKSSLKKIKINTKVVTLRNLEGFEHKSKYQLESNKFVFLSPFRGNPQRVYTETVHKNPIHNYLTIASKKIRSNYDYDKETIITKSARNAFKYWLVDFFKLSDGIDVKETISGLVSEIILKMEGKEVPINNVGFGASQLIPVVFLVLTSEETQFMMPS